jgi:hypothetical protein
MNSAKAEDRRLQKSCAADVALHRQSGSGTFFAA